MNEPTELSADVVSALEGEGRIFEDSSAAEAKEYQESQVGVVQQPGADIAGSAPVFANAGAANQITQQPSANVDQPQPSGSGAKSGNGEKN
jgi:hypothetical protein